MITARFHSTMRCGVLVLMTLSFAVACSSGSSGGSGGLPAEETLLFYVEKNGDDSRHLYAVHPDDPGNPMQVAQNIGQAGNSFNSAAVETVVGGDYDGDTLSRTHPAWVVYAGEDGHLYRVSTHLPEGPLDVPQPVRISSEADAPAVCNMVVEVDHANPLDSVLIYELPGGVDNDDCWSSSSYFVQLNDAVSDDPVLLSSFSVYDLVTRDPASGAVDELVVLEGDDFRHLDLDSRQWSTEYQFPDEDFVSRSVVLAGGVSERVLVRESEYSFLQALYMYEARERQLEDVELASGLTLQDLWDTFLHGFDTPDRILFTVEDNDLNVLLYQIAFDEHADYTIERLNKEEDTYYASILTIDEDHVAWQFEDSGTLVDVIESVAFDSGEVTELARSEDDSNFNTYSLDSPRAPDGWVHFGDWEDTLSHEAVDIRGPGFGTHSRDVERLIGNTWSPRIELTYGGVTRIPGASLEGQQAERILVAEDDRLMSLDASSPGSGLRDHGALPEDEQLEEALGYAPHSLIRARRSIGDDVFFVDTRAGQSLVRVTDNSAEVELITGF